MDATKTAAAATKTPKTMKDAVAECVAAKIIAVSAGAYVKKEILTRRIKQFMKVKGYALEGEEGDVVGLLREALGVAAPPPEDDGRILPYPGPEGTLQKGPWILGLAIPDEDDYGAKLATLVRFARTNLRSDTAACIVYNDFCKCFDVYCMTHRIERFKPTARMLRELCARLNCVVDVKDKVKRIYGLDFMET